MRKRKFELLNPASIYSLPCIDWNRCLICQNEKPEKLLCPNNSKQRDKYAGYKSLAEDLECLDSIGMLPHGMKLSRFRNEGQSLGVSFVDNNAKFHKSCRNSCDKYHYERALQKSAKKICTESFSSEATLSHKGTRSTYENLNFVEGDMLLLRRSR